MQTLFSKYWYEFKESKFKDRNVYYCMCYEDGQYKIPRNSCPSFWIFPFLFKKVPFNVNSLLNKEGIFIYSYFSSYSVTINKIVKYTNEVSWWRTIFCFARLNTNEAPKSILLYIYVTLIKWNTFGCHIFNHCLYHVIVDSIR